MNKRYARNSIILGVLAFLYLTFFAVLVSRADYECGLPVRYQIQMQDIDKPAGVKYQDTCAAAALSNAVGFSLGWNTAKTVSLYNTLMRISKYRPVSMIELWDMWMDAGKVPCGYSRYGNFTGMGHIDGYHYIESITGMLEAGYVVLLQFDNPVGDLGHVVTVYGYILKDDGSTELWYVDSDDGGNKLLKSEIAYMKRDTFFKFDGTWNHVNGFSAVRVLAPWGDK